VDGVFGTRRMWFRELFGDPEERRNDPRQPDDLQEIRAPIEHPVRAKVAEEIKANIELFMPLMDSKRLVEDLGIYRGRAGSSRCAGRVRRDLAFSAATGVSERHRKSTVMKRLIPATHAAADPGPVIVGQDRGEPVLSGRWFDGDFQSHCFEPADQPRFLGLGSSRRV
jgi:hypothetical protein